jgi:hypothetical protein
MAISSTAKKRPTNSFQPLLDEKDIRPEENVAGAAIFIRPVGPLL